MTATTIMVIFMVTMTVIINVTKMATTMMMRTTRYTRYMYIIPLVIDHSE